MINVLISKIKNNPITVVLVIGLAATVFYKAGGWAVFYVFGFFGIFFLNGLWMAAAYRLIRYDEKSSFSSYLAFFVALVGCIGIFYYVSKLLAFMTFFGPAVVVLTLSAVDYYTSTSKK